MAADPGSSTPTPRVGLRDVAAAAGVCLMTVSLSLRNSPKITPATRERVRRAAEKLGYRPDPEISRLMSRLRVSRKTRGADAIGILDLRPRLSLPVHPYDLKVREGIQQRADQLGFTTASFRLVDYDNDLKRVLRVVRARGVRGVIFLPSSQPPVALDARANWDGLAVISATNVVLAPRFHQVLPNQFGNMMTLLENVQQRGFRRVAAVIGESLELRIRHHYSAALSWHGHRERIFLLPGISSVKDNEASVLRWLQQHRPELVIAQHASDVARLAEAAGLAGQMQIISLGGAVDPRTPYVDQLPELVGDTAARLLAGMMHNNETGVPVHPQVTLIDGVFRERRGEEATTAGTAAGRESKI